MDDIETDGRDFNENNIDEGPITTIEETDGFLGLLKPKSLPANDIKPDSSKSNQNKCVCRNKLPNSNNNNDNKSNNNNIDNNKKKQARRRKKKRKLTNPYIIFYLRMLRKNPQTCIATVAREAGKKWSTMPQNEKDLYINKYKSMKKQMEKNEEKKKKMKYKI